MARIRRPALSAEQKWLLELGSLHVSTLEPSYWGLLETNVKRWSKEVSVGNLWTEIEEVIPAWRTEYHAMTNSALLAELVLPEFVPKSAKSIKEKLLRNYLMNPDCLTASFTTSSPVLPLLNDLVRTRITCKYLDGVEFLANKIADLANSLGCHTLHERQGKISGYFAQHIIVVQPVIYQIAGESVMAEISCEIQIASEMGTKMWEVSHSLYETVRRNGTADESWQWNPADPRFISSQLGHMIHLVDGLLIQLRDASKVNNER
jgi:ppGpp synthetase/RelA/SpoT-type nucleotidyltranferase